MTCPRPGDACSPFITPSPTPCSQPRPHHKPRPALLLRCPSPDLATRHVGHSRPTPQWSLAPPPRPYIHPLRRLLPTHFQISPFLPITASSLNHHGLFPGAQRRPPCLQSCLPLSALPAREGRSRGLSPKGPSDQVACSWGPFCGWGVGLGPLPTLSDSVPTIPLPGGHYLLPCHCLPCSSER